MFSSRLNWSSPPNRTSEALARLRREGAEILDLTESNPTSAGFSYDEGTITRALADPRALRYDPTPWGLDVARVAVAAYYAERGVRAPVERILITASTSEAYGYLFKLLCDGGDEVLVPRPSYPLFEFLAQLDLVRVSQYPLFYDHGWHLDSHDLAARITSRTRAIVLVNPNNPTGSFIKRGELAELTALCRRHGLALISDEVFSDYPLTADPERVWTVAADASVLSFSLSGLSKSAGLPQLKLGWMLMGGPDPQVDAARQRLELIADSYLSVATPVQLAAPELLRAGAAMRVQIGARTRRNLEHLVRAVRDTSVGLLQLEGGWYATLQVARIRAEEDWVLMLLEGQRTLVQPGYFYDFSSEAHLIVSLLTPERIFDEGIMRLLKLAAA